MMTTSEKNTMIAKYMGETMSEEDEGMNYTLVRYKFRLAHACSG
jgi:hypothetical protein